MFKKKTLYKFSYKIYLNVLSYNLINIIIEAKDINQAIRKFNRKMKSCMNNYSIISIEEYKIGDNIV